MDALDISKWRPLGDCYQDEDPLWLLDDDDIPLPPPEITFICAKCPVRTLCLEFALDTEAENGEAGIWGGTTPFQRQQLKRERSRVKCPSCQSMSVVKEGRGEICLDCGISWII